MTLRRAADVSVGDELPPLVVPVTRADLVRYAGASGDFNVIHWNERVARSVGLPNVIAHGMFTMGQAINVVTRWAGDPSAVVEYGVRFTRPVLVPDDEVGSSVEVSAVVVSVADGRAQIDLTVKYAGQTVLAKAKATVALADSD